MAVVVAAVMVAVAAVAVAVAAAVAAASTVMETILRAVLVKEVKDIFREERVELLRVGLEVAVVYEEVAVVLEAVEVTLEEMGVRVMNFPVGEGVYLLTMGKISKMNVASIAMNMVELSSRFFSDTPSAVLYRKCKANSVLKADCC